MWIREADCYNLVNNMWNNMERKDIVEKINLCCLKLKESGGRKAKEMQLKINKYRGDLMKYRTRRDMYGICKYNEVQ